MGELTKPDIFVHHNYRDYIRELISYGKEVRGRFSIRTFAKEIGVTHALLSQILNSKRNLTDQAQEKISQYFELDDKEIAYFSLLRVVADAKNSNERYQAFSEIQKTRQYRKLNPTEFETYRYLTNWYYVAIREMVQYEDFSLDPKWIKDHLIHKVSLEEVKLAVDFLKKHNYIIEDSKTGEISLPQLKIECKKGVFQLALAEYHRKMLAITAESIDTVPREQRRLFSYTFAVPKNNFKAISDILDRAQKEIEELEKGQSGPDSVYHVTLAAVPLARGGS
jgi:uncharacterized protein (TIGR02147 family)